MLTIRFAAPEDEERIVSFIDENWSGNRTLVTSRAIFRYQYMTFTPCGFVLAEEDGRIIGIKGYVPMNRSERPDIAAALAIAVKNSHPMLNMEMQRYLERETACRMMCSTGLNPNTAARIYPLFRYKVDKLKQYYILDEREDYRVASVSRRVETPASGDAALLPLPSPQELRASIDLSEYAEQRPYKDEAYLSYRYYRHPFYRYELYGIQGGDGAVTAVLAGREIAVNGRRIFRIVDLLGNRCDISRSGAALRRLMKEKDYEYIDFCCYGLPDECLSAAGFALRDESDPNIIPNYFEPFVQKNVDIWFFCKQHENFFVCKADGDQDRPNSTVVQ